MEWTDVIQELRIFMTEFLNNGGEVVKENVSSEKVNTEVQSEYEALNDHREPKNDLERKIIDVLDEYVRPAVESDGGAIVFDSFEEGTVNLVLKGACSGCPSSTMTLKAGIEGMLKQMLPDDIKQVEAVNG